VLSDSLEFPTVTLPWVHRGASVSLVSPVDGELPPSAFAESFAPKSATVAVSHVQFSNGCRLDLDGLGAAKGRRRLVVCASQSAGALPIDVARSAVDALACSGHKWLCAGYGAGFVYIGRELLERRPRTIGWLSVANPFSFERLRYELLPSNRRVEMGCPSFGPIFALGAAVRFITGIGIERIEARVLALNTYLTDELERAGIEVRSPGGCYRSGVTIAAVPDPPAAVAFLRARNVDVTEKVEGVRFATHFYNDERDVALGVAALTDYVRGLR
jgi:selenocysteine lyase/cysteine desulfurase